MIVGVLRNNLLKHNLVRNISTRVPKKFYEIPYHEQYEYRDFLVSINTDNLPDKLTKPTYISSELRDIINSKYSKTTLKKEFIDNSDKFISNFKYSPW
tara:strand:- start:227 stop:520 length:294 start_codon:yes stop_codon:yes gene_type:complete